MKIYSQELLPLTKEYFLNKKPAVQKAIILIIAAVTVSAFLWISFAPFEEVVKAAGYVRPLENISPVANSVTGRIENIFYRTGQHVKKGKLLLCIDPTQLQAECDFLSKQTQKERTDLNGLYQIQKSIGLGKNIISAEQKEASLRYELWVTSLERLENIRQLKLKDYQRELQLSPSMTTAAKIQRLESEYIVARNEYEETDLTFRYQVAQEISDTEISLKRNEAKLKELATIITDTIKTPGIFKVDASRVSAYKAEAAAYAKEAGIIKAKQEYISAMQAATTYLARAAARVSTPSKDLSSLLRGNSASWRSNSPSRKPMV